MRTLESIQEEIEALGEVDLFGTAKEVSHLPEVLDDDEHIKYLTSGLMDDTTWLIVCTQKRIVLVDYGFLFGVKQSEMALENINSISFTMGLMFGSIEIWHGGACMLIENCYKATVKPFVDAVNAAKRELKNQSANPMASRTANLAPSTDDDVIGKLERLATLKEKGLLSDEEFAAQKAKILGQGGAQERKPQAETVAPVPVNMAPPAKTAQVSESVQEEKTAAPAQNFASPKEGIETYYNDSVKGMDSTFTSRFMLADSNPKKVIAAVNAYAKGCKGEEILAIYDDSAFGNGKIGFLLSNKKLYVCNSFEKPKEINLADIYSIVATPKLLNSSISVNDIRIDTVQVNGSGTEILAAFLQKAVPLAMNVTVESSN